MLQDVHVVVQQRRVVERRDVPDAERDVEDCERHDRRRDPARERTDDRPTQCRPQHPARRACDEQRWHDELHDEVLHHVPAEQVEVAQVVQRPVQDQEQQEQATAERDALPGRRTNALGGTSTPKVEPPERSQSNDRARVDGPVIQRQGLRGVQEQCECHQCARDSAIRRRCPG